MFYVCLFVYLRLNFSFAELIRGIVRNGATRGGSRGVVPHQLHTSPKSAEIKKKISRATLGDMSHQLHMNKKFAGGQKIIDLKIFTPDHPGGMIYTEACWYTFPPGTGDYFLLTVLIIGVGVLFCNINCFIFVNPARFWVYGTPYGTKCPDRLTWT